MSKQIYAITATKVSTVISFTTKLLFCISRSLSCTVLTRQQGFPFMHVHHAHHGHAHHAHVHHDQVHHECFQRIVWLLIHLY